MSTQIHPLDILNICFEYRSHGKLKKIQIQYFHTYSEAR